MTAHRCEYSCRSLHPHTPVAWCDRCLAEARRDVDDQAEEHELGRRAQEAGSVVPATDSERRAYLDERAPLVGANGLFVTEAVAWRPVEPPDARPTRLLACCQLVMNGSFRVIGRIIQGNDRVFLAFPNRARRDGSYHDLACPINRATRVLLEGEAIAAYRRLVAAERSAQGVTEVA